MVRIKFVEVRVAITCANKKITWVSSRDRKYQYRDSYLLTIFSYLHNFLPYFFQLITIFKNIFMESQTGFRYDNIISNESQ